MGAVEEEEDEFAGLTADEKQEIIAANNMLFSQYLSLFSDKLPDHVPPITKETVFHNVQLIDPTKVHKSRYYTIPHKLVPAARQIVENNVRSGRWVSSSSPHSSGWFVKPKKDPNALPRSLIDYRKLNANTVKDVTAIPDIEDILRMILSGHYWGKTDITSAYDQTHNLPAVRPLLAIATMWGNYEPVMMPQGLCNAPATNQRRLNKILAKYLGVICFVFYDDVIIFGAKTLSDHIKRVRLVLDAILDAGIILSPKKSVLVAAKIEALGHYVSRRGLSADPLKIKKIERWPIPTTKKHVQEFMGLANYCRKFVRDLAKWTGPLTQLTRKNVPFVWGEKEQRCFQHIKSLFRKLPTLRGIRL